MATKAEAARALAAIERSEKHRKEEAAKHAGPTKHDRIKAADHKTKTGHALHGRTKLQADAKAGKPDTGLDGGEARTGGATTGKPSRKSTRRGLPGGEKPNSETRAMQQRNATPEARAARNKVRR